MLGFGRHQLAVTYDQGCLTMDVGPKMMDRDHVHPMREPVGDPA